MLQRLFLGKQAAQSMHGISAVLICALLRHAVVYKLYVYTHNESLQQYASENLCSTVQRKYAYLQEAFFIMYPNFKGPLHRLCNA